MMRFVIAVLSLALLSGWSFTAWRAAAIARAYPPRGAFVSLPTGFRFHYTERQPHGPARGTVLLLHGASGNQADLMLPLGDRLAAAGFRVIAMDRPGHGWSERTDDPTIASPDRQADLIAAALRQMGVGRAIVVGHSWAGALAADLALDHPEMTEALVLISPVLHPWSGGVAWYNRAAALPVFGAVFTHLVTLPAGLAALPEGVAEVFAPGQPPPDFIARTGLPLVLRPAEFAANADDVVGLLDFVSRLAPRLGAIAVPTAIVAGDSDGIVSTERQARRAAAEIPGATLTVLPGVGHSPHWADPDAVAVEIVKTAGRVADAVPVAAQ